MLVKDEFQRQGIGTKLVQHLIQEDKKMSVFSTKRSQNIFLNAGFYKVREGKNDVWFMHRDPVSKAKEGLIG